MSEQQRVVDAASVDQWAETVDVVVVGFGMAGACAAIEAAAAGASRAPPPR